MELDSAILCNKIRINATKSDMEGYYDLNSGSYWQQGQSHLSVINHTTSNHCLLVGPPVLPLVL